MCEKASLISTNHRLIENCLSGICDLKELFNEHVESRNFNDSEVDLRFEQISSKISQVLDSTYSNKNESSKSTLSAILALLKEVLSVVYKYLFPIYNIFLYLQRLDDSSPRKNTSPGPSKVQCTMCGGFDHLKRDCPKKLQFCARCLLTEHKTYECPSLISKEQCHLCCERNMGDLAYGHKK